MIRYATASVVTAAQRADADRLAWALGYQPDPSTGASTYSVPLSATGSEPATHYGYNAQSTTLEFVQMLQSAKAGTLPPIDWQPYGLTADRVLSIVAQMQVEVEAGDSHPWPVLLSRMGLLRIESSDV